METSRRNSKAVEAARSEVKLYGAADWMRLNGKKPVQVLDTQVFENMICDIECLLQTILSSEGLLHSRVITTAYVLVSFVVGVVD